MQVYVEAAGHDEPIFSIDDEIHGELNGMLVTTPYQVVFPFDKKRQIAKAMSNMVYVYGFLELIEYNLLRHRRKYVQQRTRGGGAKITIPNLLMGVRELILDATGKYITETTRSRGQLYVLNDIVGREIDLGVECLSGRGTIAGVTSRAYQDVFTLTYTCGRSVGIGAHSPILLTG
ncbi:hypothetical protein DVH05_017243 [Phytophthora capsici]|nr:hypothetical protein DVH05_017243 [Phytophthora capsici]